MRAVAALTVLLLFSAVASHAQTTDERRDRLERREQRLEQRDRLQDRREQRLERQRERFEEADHDADGAINREEARRSFPRLHHFFDDIDKNHDNLLEPVEVRDFWRKRARERRIDRQGHDPRY